MPRPARRRRCAHCGVLVDFVMDYWPKGLYKAPRLLVCQPCHAELTRPPDQLPGVA